MNSKSLSKREDIDLGSEDDSGNVVELSATVEVTDEDIAAASSTVSASSATATASSEVSTYTGGAAKITAGLSFFAPLLAFLL